MSGTDKDNKNDPDMYQDTMRNIAAGGTGNPPKPEPPPPQPKPKPRPDEDEDEDAAAKK